MQDLNYECFFLLPKPFPLIQVSRCWDPWMEGKLWSNIMCVSRSERGMLAVLHSKTVLVF